jgi:hypothetical protein
MNIFYVNDDPVLAAQDLCDKHIVKMILEGMQMMSTAHHVLRPSAEYLSEILKPTHTNHPCNVWIRKSSDNYRWLHLHTVALCHEYSNRYAKQHRLEDKFVYLDGNPSPIGSLTPPAQAMPIEFKVYNDPVQAYRNYYINSKSRFAEWRYSPTPAWYSQAIAA